MDHTMTSLAGLLTRDVLVKYKEKRIVYLCVEGARTEPEYLTKLNELSDDTAVRCDIHIIERDHSYSAIKCLVADLDAYKRKNSDIINDNDILGIVADRDGNKDIHLYMEKCKQENYQFYFSNPCFEFWLLLHLRDVQSELETLGEQKLYANRYVGSKTYLSKLVQEQAGHSKRISQAVFDAYYRPNIHLACARAKTFATTQEDSLTGLASNLYELVEILNIRENRRD